MVDFLINKQNRTILNILACHSQGICFAVKNWIIESKYNFLVSLKNNNFTSACLIWDDYSQLGALPTINSIIL